MSVGGIGGERLGARTSERVMFVFHLTWLFPRLSCVYHDFDQYGQPIANFNSGVRGEDGTVDIARAPRCAYRLEELLLLPGRDRVNVAVRADGQLQDHVEGAAVFDVEGGMVQGRRLADLSRHGCVY